MKEKTIQFSIVVPVFQCENTLERSVESVLCQEKCNYEIILVDDGSLDTSGVICDRYHEKYPNIISVLHKKNEGPLMARIDGILLAKGEYIMFLDADDRFLPNALQCIDDVISDNNPDVIVFNHIRRYEDGSIEKMILPFHDKEVYADSEMPILRKRVITNNDLNSLWQKCVRKDVLKKIEQCCVLGNMMLGEDKLMSMNILNEAHKVLFISEPLYEYQIHDSSTSHWISVKHYRDLQLVHSQVLKYISRWGLDECLMACHKNNIELGITSVSYISCNVLRHQKSYSDLKQMVLCVKENPYFWESIEICKDELSMKRRIFCFLIKTQRVSLLYLCSILSMQLKKHGSNKIYRG